MDESKAEEAKLEGVALQVQGPGTGSPPVYNATDVTDPESPPTYSDAPPPTYDSMFGKMKAAQEGSTGKVDYARRVLVMLFCGTLCCGIWIAFLFAIPVAALVIGVMFLHQCPRERFIPIYLVVFGVFGIVKALINIVQMVCQKKKGVDASDPDDASNKKPNPIDSLLNCFLSAWFIAGCVWIYRVHGDYQSTDPTDLDTYCHQTVYLFAFWLQTAQFIILGLCLLLCCGLCCVMCCVAGKSG